MNKITKILVPLAIISLFVGASFAQANYGVTVGQIFTFDVTTSSWTLKVGANSGTGTGFAFAETSFAEGTQFTVEVDAVVPASSVSWTMAAGAKTDTGSNNPLDLLGFVFLLFYPFLLSSGLIIWNQTAIEMGPEILTLFFVEPITMSEFCYELANESFISTEFTDDEWTFDQIGGYFDNASTIAVFDWILKARYYSSAVNTDYSGTYQFKFAFDKNTGAMKGYKLHLDYTGTVSGQILEMQFDQLVEQAGYDIGSFHFGGFAFIPGFEWFVAIPAIALLGIIPIILRKKK